MTIAIGSDHGGYLLKKALIPYLKNKGHRILDVGCFSADGCDYPQFAYRVARLVSARKVQRGIIICKSGIGTSIAANKVRGIRAALCLSPKDARLSIEHNNANVLSLGAASTGQADAKRIVSVWLCARFQGGRHARRVRQITAIERKARQ